MDLQFRTKDLAKLGAQLVGHKLQQFQLATRSNIVIETASGKVKGVKRKTVYGRESYYSFEGIPYAKPPVGNLRFRAPKPVEPWTGVRDCSYCRSKPLQRHFVLKFVDGSEDCLYLNIYTKKINTQKPLPVMIWIYGGGFQLGEASRDLYSPDYFMRKDIVFVAINYRVGAMGFLSMPDQDLDVPGNAGLKDQVLALRWIKANIAAFNGDPNNITLFGESAGGVSTHIMMITEQTRGLFHKAIIQSGSALCTWAATPDHGWAYRLALRMGYTGADCNRDILQYLSKANAKSIAANDLHILTQDEMRHFWIFAFGPVIEPYHTADCIVTKPYTEMLATAWGNTLPIIIGYNSFEGLFSYQITRQDPTVYSTFENVLPHYFRERCTRAEIASMIRDIKHAHLGDAQRESMDLMECLELFGHRQIVHDVHRHVLSRIAYSPQVPTYLYRFDFDSAHFNHYRLFCCGQKVRGVSHGDDLSYLFYHIAATKLNKATPEYRTIERMIGMWTAFAMNSNPNCIEIATTTEWQPVATEEEPHLHKLLNIGENLEFIEQPEAKTLEVWNSFYKKEPLY